MKRRSALFLFLLLLLTPMLVWAQSPVLSTYMSGNAVDSLSAVATDSAGNAYFVGSSSSTNFLGGMCSGALTGAQNIVVGQITPGGSVGWCEYFGGTGTDSGEGIAVDGMGNVFIAAMTTSAGLGTAGAFQPTLVGPQDAIVCELSPGGSIVWCTYLGGGTSKAEANAIVVDSADAVYVVGLSTGPGYPVQGSNIPGRKYGGGPEDAVVTKINPGGSSVGWSTYLGGKNDDVGYAIGLSASGTVYVDGYTTSRNFPVTAAAFQTKLNAQDAGWITELGTDGSLVASTYLGGSTTSTKPCPACASSLALDGSGNVWVGGLTLEANFPVTANAAQGKFAGGGGHDAFIVEMSSTLQSESYGTFLGGTGDDGCVALAIDGSGDIWCHGNTFSTNFPVLNAWQNSNGGPSDAFLAALSSTGQLVYSTYLGGSRDEFGKATQSIAVIGSDVWFNGWTLSSNYPLVNPIQSTLLGTQAGFLAHFAGLPARSQ